MPTLRPSMIFFGFQAKDWTEFNEIAHFIDLENISKTKPLPLAELAFKDVRIFILNTEYLDEPFNNFLNTYESHLKKWIWILKDSPAWRMEEWQFLFKKFRLLCLIDNKNFDRDLQQALEEAWSILREQEQTEIFNQLLEEKNLVLQNEQTQILKNLEHSKENKKNLQKKIKLIEEWGFLLRQSLWIIHRSENLKEVEELLLDLLKVPLKLKTIEIVISGARPDTIYGGNSILKITLQSELSNIATLWVGKKDDSVFSSEEKDFFNRLAEALELAISRIKVVEDLAELEQQWQRTFDAIADPVLLTNENFEIIQTNSAARARITNNQEQNALTCYKALFKRTQPCPECKRNRRFELALPQTLQNFEVSSHQVKKYNNTSSPIYIHLYREITHLKQMEKSLVEQSSQLALGTLSSSIAHELNNPVGGILTLSQLLKMDFAPETKEHQIFTNIEKKAYECKEVIETLLEFSHAHTNEPNTQCDIGDLLQQGLNLFKTIQEDSFEKLTFNKFPEPIFLQAKPKLLVDLFYLLFAALHKVEEEKWQLTLASNPQGFACIIEAQSKQNIDPKILSHTPLVQYFKSAGLNLIINDSILEIFYSSP